MGRQQVIDKLGQPGHQSQQSMWYDLEWHEVEVRMNDGGQVIGVSGTRLELGEVDYTPEKPHGELSPDLVTFLGGEGWKLARRDFSHDWNDEEFQLTIQFGCTGWYFFLGERTG